MILQYRGFKNNWTYEEAETITTSLVEITKAEKLTNNRDREIGELKEISEKIEQEIREATNCANIIYITEKPVYELGYVKIAILCDKNKEVTYVFDTNKEIYLLNNSGKTVARI